MTRTCIIWYDTVTNLDEFRGRKFGDERPSPPYEFWTERRLLEAHLQPGPFCCEEMSEIVEYGFILRGDESMLVMAYQFANDTFNHEMKLCPFCGAKIEYAEHKKLRVVNRPEPKWVLEEVPTNTKEDVP